MKLFTSGVLIFIVTYTLGFMLLPAMGRDVSLDCRRMSVVVEPQLAARETAGKFQVVVIDPVTGADRPGVTLNKVLDKPHLDLTTPIGRGFIAFLSALAEDERQRILKRANDGRRAARARGTKFGRKLKLSQHQQAEALKRFRDGESCRQIAKTFGVHHATISRLA